MRRDCDCIHEGDLVAHKDNMMIWGRVLGFEGSVATIRRQHPDPKVGACWREQYHVYELERIDDEYDGPDGGSEEDVEDNVVPVDFTRGVKLTKNTKTKGAA